MRLAILTGLYVGVVCSAQIGAQKIVVLPFTDLEAPGGTYAIGLALALIELAHRTAPTRREGWLHAQVMIGCGFAASALLAAYIAIVAESRPAFPGQTFDDLADTWRIVLSSLAAFLVSETADNAVGAWLRGRLHDGGRVIVSNAVSVPLDSFVFLALAFGWDGLDFFEGQVVAKLASTLVLGLPVVLAARRLVAESRGQPTPVPRAVS